MNPNFLNRWLELPDSERIKTSFVIDRAAHARLQALHGKTGTLQTTVSILIDKLINELKSFDYDPAEYERAITECTINLGKRSPAIESSAGEVIPSPIEAPDRNDRRGTVSVAREPEGTQESSDASLASDNGGVLKRSRRKK